MVTIIVGLAIVIFHWNTVQDNLQINEIMGFAVS